MHIKNNMRLFEDKDRNDARRAFHAETKYSAYDRSSFPALAAGRHNLQQLLNLIPPERRMKRISEMRHEGRGSTTNDQQFDGAFLELFCHAMLKGTGASVEVEPRIVVHEENLTPDFRVTEYRPDGTQVRYIVEVTDLSFASDDERKDAWKKGEFLDLLNEISSPDFYAMVEFEGAASGSTPSRNAILDRVRKWLQTQNYDAVSSQALKYGNGPAFLPHLTAEWYGCKVRITLLLVGHARRPYEGQFVGMSALHYGGARVDYPLIVRKEIEEKTKKYRKWTDSLIVAIRVPEGTSWRDVAEALFGDVHDLLTVSNSEPTEILSRHTEQYRNGLWFNNSGPLNRHLTGVVALRTLYPHCLSKAEACFFRNPWADESLLPGWTGQITHAGYVNGKIGISAGVQPFHLVADNCAFEDAQEGVIDI